MVVPPGSIRKKREEKKERKKAKEFDPFWSIRILLSPLHSVIHNSSCRKMIF